MDQSYFDRLAAAFVRGKLCGDPAAGAHAELFARPLGQLAEDELWALIRLGLARELRLHKFERTMDLARVRKALGILRGLRPAELLRRRQPFAWNATNVTRQVRAPLIELFASYRARVRVVYVDAPFDSVIARNQQRENAVPARVIERLASKLEAPDLTEAHIVEWIST
jgi:predicted kinase